MNRLLLLTALLAAAAACASPAAASASVRAFASDSASGAAPSRARSAQRPAAWSPAVAVKADEYLRVAVQLDGGEAEHVSVVLRAAGDASRVAVLAASDGEGAGEYEAAFKAGQRLANVLGGPGDYEVSVVVGRAQGDGESFEWRAGTAAIALPAAKPTAAARKAAEWRSELPELSHTFPAEARRPNALVSLVFTGLAAVPFVGLLGGLGRLGLERSVPGGAAGYLAALLFQGSLAATLAVIVIYWLSLNIFQALAAVGVLSVATLFFGQRALRIHAEAKTKAE